MIAATQSNHPLAAVPSAPDTKNSLEQACARLRGAGMRITKPRVAIFEALLRHRGPTSIEQLHLALGRKSCDLVTVYRCLAAFEGVGLVRRCFSHQGTSLWELGLNAPRHYPIVCKSCGRMDQVDYFPVEAAERALHDRGYTEISHMVEFFGVCPQCQQAAGNRLTTPSTDRSPA